MRATVEGHGNVPPGLEPVVSEGGLPLVSPATWPWGPDADVDPPQLGDATNAGASASHFSGAPAVTVSLDGLTMLGSDVTHVYLRL